MRPAELIVLAVLVAVGTDSDSADPQQGRLLYETYCGTCHYPKLHDRKSSQVDTVAKLRVEVARWTAQTGRRFTPAEIEDLVDYLNRSHYRLAK